MRQNRTEFVTLNPTADVVFDHELEADRKIENTSLRWKTAISSVEDATPIRISSEEPEIIKSEETADGSETVEREQSRSMLFSFCVSWF